MNRERGESLEKLSGMPHVCGDEPENRTRTIIIPQYAPRMWG